MKNLKNLKILTPLMELDKLKISELIREHERRFLYDGEKTQITYTELKENQDFVNFVKEKEFTDYKIKKDTEWGEHYNIKSISMGFAIQMKKVSVVTETQVRNAINLLKVKKLPLTTLQNLIAITSWHTTGYIAYEIWPWGYNPYEPTVDLLELGVIPRRVKDAWLIGYVKKL